MNCLQCTFQSEDWKDFFGVIDDETILCRYCFEVELN